MLTTNIAGHCSVITKTSLYYQHCFHHKSET